ncbi:MAG: ribonuclease Y [Cytophagales bacterium]|nr:ribonuclease Y [Cytophagales bacterium]
MNLFIYILITGIAALGTGIFIGRFLMQKVLTKQERSAKEKAELIIREAEVNAESLKKNKILEAKESYLQIKTEFEDEATKKKNQIIKNEQIIRQREESLSKKSEEINRKEAEADSMRENLKAQLEIAAKQNEESEKIRLSQVSALEKIAKLTAEKAKGQLIEALKEEAQSQASYQMKQIIDEAKLKATKEAKKIVIETIQRTAGEHTIENCVSVFHLETDELKGKIIGREGRNIRTLEIATGVELIVDDTPEAIVISCFDPVRREIAKLALQKLVQDGRIHPARIEEVVEQIKKNMSDEIVEIGERTVIDLGIHGLHSELIKYVGRMRFRSSYGQNLLQHSCETVRLCATMSAELGLDVKLAKRAGLLHDIGKVYPEKSDITHALLGMEIAEKYNEHPEVCNAIGAHHDEIEMTCLLSPVVQACDAISGSRPGARREIAESYMQRLRDLEALATAFEGVTKCYAIQAGRECRVMVDAENVTDEKAEIISFDIAQKIEKEMKYPGQVKITVIREKRAINFAK